LNGKIKAEIKKKLNLRTIPNKLSILPYILLGIWGFPQGGAAVFCLKNKIYTKLKIFSLVYITFKKDDFLNFKHKKTRLTIASLVFSE
jgi:hypothetical protein